MSPTVLALIFYLAGVLGNAGVLYCIAVTGPKPERRSLSTMTAVGVLALTWPALWPCLGLGFALSVLVSAITRR